MTSLVIPLPVSDTVNSIREIVADEGDLILLVTSTQMLSNPPSSLTVGVFSGVKRTRPAGELRPFSIRLESPYYLYCSRRFGQVDVPLSRESKMTWYRLTPHIKVLEVGQERVVEVLSGWEGYKAHAEWVAKLKKPYVRSD